MTIPYFSVTFVARLHQRSQRFQAVARPVERRSLELARRANARGAERAELRFDLAPRAAEARNRRAREMPGERRECGAEAFGRRERMHAHEAVERRGAQRAVGLADHG